MKLTKEMLTEMVKEVIQEQMEEVQKKPSLGRKINFPKLSNIIEILEDALNILKKENLSNDPYIRVELVTGLKHTLRSVIRESKIK